MKNFLTKSLNEVQLDYVITKLHKVNQKFKLVIVLFVLTIIIFIILLWYILSYRKKNLKKNDKIIPVKNINLIKSSNISKKVLTVLLNEKKEEDIQILSPFLTVLLCITVVFLIIFNLITIYIYKKRKLLKTKCNEVIKVKDPLKETFKIGTPVNSSKVITEVKNNEITESELANEELKIRKNYKYLKSIAERYGELTEDPTDMKLHEINSRIKDLIKELGQEVHKPDSFSKNKKIDDLNKKIQVWENVKVKNSEYIKQLELESKNFYKDFEGIINASIKELKDDIKEQYGNKRSQLVSRMGDALLGVIEARNITVEKEGVPGGREITREEYIRRRPDLTNIPLNISIRQKLALYGLLPVFSPNTEEKVYKWKESLRQSILKAVTNPNEFNVKDESNKASYFWSKDFLNEQNKKNKEEREILKQKNKAFREKQIKSENNGKLKASNALLDFLSNRNSNKINKNSDETKTGKLNQSRINALDFALKKTVKKETHKITQEETNIATISAYDFKKRSKQIEANLINILKRN